MISVSFVEIPTSIISLQKIDNYINILLFYYFQAFLRVNKFLLLINR